MRRLMCWEDGEATAARWQAVEKRSEDSQMQGARNAETGMYK